MAAASPIQRALGFLALHRASNDSDARRSSARAAEIIRICQLKLAVLTAEDEKQKLNHIIQLVSGLLRFPNANQVRELQTTALTLPSQFQEGTNLTSVSLKVSMACIFILAFTAALAAGFAFQAWYYTYLTANVLVDYLVMAAASVGIPIGGLGLFSFGVYCSTGRFSAEMRRLQNEISTFCEETPIQNMADTQDHAFDARIGQISRVL
jgi:hypothetical protein